jgi:hypothetical protein
MFPDTPHLLPVDVGISLEEADVVMMMPVDTTLEPVDAPILLPPDED